MNPSYQKTLEHGGWFPCLWRFCDRHLHTPTRGLCRIAVVGTPRRYSSRESSHIVRYNDGLRQSNVAGSYVRAVPSLARRKDTVGPSPH